MKKFIGFIIVLGIFTFMALFFKGVNIPIPSSYLLLVVMTNGIAAFVSIFVQRWVIVLYEANVYEAKDRVVDYSFKYFAIGISGLNYLIQKMFTRLPFIFNKLLAVIFFLFIMFQLFTLVGIFD
jgi:hypothetical protein